MPSPRWQVPPDASFVWRDWDDEYVVYHEQSGDTHLLNALGARTLELLREGPVETGPLARALAGEAGIEPTPDFVANVDRIVGEFHALGLVERVEDAPR